ncbi:MAG: helix-turn-helix domain-containing protein [Gammaproteobacteria bacterium]|jgi:UDP-2,3-diacylglucosamine pyrophosphatase LpxH|nr:helix-turn-helix domain-containing protein [Gammaproteobacteria bacterium]
MTDHETLKKWANERQLKTLQALIDHGTQAKAAKALGINVRNVQRHLRAVRDKAGRQGYAPDHDMLHTAPNSHIVKGVSTLYGDNGQVKQQWVKTNLKADETQQAMLSFVEGLSQDLPKYTPHVKAPELPSNDLMSCYVIGDHHLGMLSSKNRTSDDWSIELAENTLIAAMGKLLQAGGNTGTGMLCNLGDFLHANDSTNTTQSGNLLEVDGYFSDSFEAAARLLRGIIDMMLLHHTKVVIMNARGNHDRDSSLMLNILLKAYYEDELRVEIVDNVRKLVNFSFGSNFICAHHGDKMKPQRMYEMITRDMAKEWGNSEHRFGWMGHIHHKTAHEIGGIQFESWNVLAATDSWHDDNGFGSERSMTCVTLHKRYGEHMRHKVGIKQIKEML